MNFDLGIQMYRKLTVYFSLFSSVAVKFGFKYITLFMQSSRPV